MTREEARRRARELVGQMTVEERASQLRYDAPAIERLGVPAYNWWGEALHGVARAGVATSFPQAIAMAATFDTELLRKAGDVAATEGRAKQSNREHRLILQAIEEKKPERAEELAHQHVLSTVQNIDNYGLKNLLEASGQLMEKDFDK